MSNTTFVPREKPKPVCGKGEFPFAAIGLDHNHIHGQCGGLIAAGGELRYVYDPDARKVEELVNKFPGSKAVDDPARILDDPEIRLVASAAIPNDRGPLGLRVMDAGKDYFVDKAPFTDLDQLAAAKKKVAETGKKYAVFYGERLSSECSVFAGQLIQQGVIGRVIQVLGLGPHRLNAPSRPPWFFEKKKYGGIICDIGSHQVEQFLFFTGATDATVASAAVANYHHKEKYPELEDFGEASMTGSNGASGYFRVDWFTPEGLGNWGDIRTIILGTEGYIEMRKTLDLAHEKVGNHLFVVTQDATHHLKVDGQVGNPYFGELILDCLNRTEKAMTQEHAFKAAEISLQAQAVAKRLE